MIDPLLSQPTLGELGEPSRQAYYASLQEEAYRGDRGAKSIFRDPEKHLYEAREPIVAYILPDGSEIVPATSIEPDAGLANQALDVTLDRFYVQRYPGSSAHRIQINFSVEHLVNLAESPEAASLTTQSILYGYILEAVDRQAAPAPGAAVFRGLRIRNELQMTVATINLADRVEERILEALESDTMKSGLTLLSTTNPVFPMVSELVMGATKMFLNRNKNKPIHRVPIGFLINAATADPKLREGSYLLVQADADWVDLNEYYWRTDGRGRVEHKQEHKELPFNHMVFSIKKSMP